MKKYEGFLICSDFDGTLVCNNKISEENTSAIKYFQDNGGLFCIVSGRHSVYLEKYSDYFLSNTYMVCANGAIVYDPYTKKNVYEAYLDTSDFINAVCKIEQSFPEIGNIEVLLPNGQSILNVREKKSFEAFVKSIDDRILKSIMYVDKNKSERLRKSVEECIGKDFNVFRSAEHMIEILPQKCDKGSGVAMLRKLLGDRAKTVICVGDFENDISMLKEADIGYAVENAPYQVKESADRITVSYTESAIAKIIYEI